jgi:molybdopterin molybdotransferase
MIEFRQALELLGSEAARAVAMRGFQVEPTPLDEALGRVLAEPLMARLDMPSFDNSAVDGYALSATDRCEFQVVRQVAAGSDSGDPLRPGQAARVFTGAPIPPGTAAVAMQEDVVVSGDQIEVQAAMRPGANIRRRGEEFAAGRELLPAGTIVSPSTLSLLASQGVQSVACRSLPRVTVVVTGSELVAPGDDLAEGQIYESNGVGLQAACKALGLNVQTHLVEDRLEATQHLLARLLDEHEVVITSGGVSVGDHDLVRPACLALGMREVFWRVNVKPGKPVFFAERDGRFVLGLPGNPVSALVTFCLFARPLLLALAGAEAPMATLRACLTRPLRKKPGRHEFVRGILAGGLATPTEGQGSHMAGGLAAANCLIHFPAEDCELAAGEEVEVSLLRWGLV